MWELGGVVYLIVTVPSQHTPEAAPGSDVSQSNVSHSLVDTIILVCADGAFIGLGLRAWFLFVGAFCFRCLVAVTVVL